MLFLSVHYGITMIKLLQNCFIFKQILEACIMSNKRIKV